MHPKTLRPERARSLISRRTVVVGTAWAVPAVVVATAAPAMAISGPTVSILDLCQNTDLTLRLRLNVTNPSTNATGQLTVSGVTVAGVVVVTPPVSPSNIPANSTTTVTVTLPALPSTIASATVTVNYSIKVGSITTTSSVTTTVNVTACPAP